MDFISPWIHTTERCNLRCHYCYVKGKAVTPITVYTALKKLLLEIPVKHRHLRFAGGEPLLVFDMWEAFARDMLHHKGTTVEVLTNLCAPPDNFWKFTELEGVNISVSIDNGKMVKKLDNKMAERLQRLRCPWIMTTLTKENVQEIDVLATFIGINNYGWAITTDYFGINDPSWEVLAEALLKITTILKDFNYDFTKVSFNNFSIKNNFSGCRAGNEMFSVGCNGNIFSCQTQIGTSNVIGNVFNGYRRSTLKSRPVCEKCSVFGLCTGWCRLHYTPNHTCDLIKLFATEVLKETKNAQ